jgi:competence protein ComEC
VTALGPFLGRLVNTLITPFVGSLACTIATLPVLIVHFGVLSWSGLLTNVVAVPLSSVAIVLPGVVALVGATFGWHIDCLWISDLLTPWLEDIARWGAEFPTYGAHGGGTRRLIGLSIGAVLLLVWMSRGAHGRRVLLGGLVATTVGLWPMAAPTLGQLRLVLLAVGHGDALVVTLPDGRHLLVDGGGDPLGLRDVGKDIVLPSLAALGVDRLHAIVLSHPHPDHYRGLVAVAANMEVSEFWWNGEAARDPSFALLLDHLRTQGTSERRFCETPLALTLGTAPDDVTIDVLHPLAPESGRGCVDEDLHANDNSLVLKLRYGAFSVLLSGDLERDAEARVVASNANLRSTVLKVPHHGSKTSSTDAFLDRVAPELAISGSADQGRFAFPDPEVLQRYADRGIPLWITGRHGAVTITTDGRQWHYRGEDDDGAP